MALRQDLHFTQTPATYTCRACGLYQLATVSAVGIGVGYLGTAATNAADDAQRMVSMLLALKRCPRCGVRDERIARRNVRTRWLTFGSFVAIGLLTAVVVGVLFADRPMLGLAVGAGVALFMAGFGWMQQRAMVMRYPSDAEAAVVLSEPPAGAPAATTATTASEGWKYI